MKKAQILNKQNNFDNEFEAVLQNIMTAREYSHTKHSIPYIFNVKVGDLEISYFGTPHSRNPKDPLFEQIKTTFNRVNPDIVFVEGINIVGDKTAFNEKVRSTSHEEAIDLAGESGFTLKLAVDKGVDWNCPEPTDEDLYKYLLLEGYSKEHVFTWEIFQNLPQYNLQINKQGFRKYAAHFIERLKQVTDWKEFDYSYEHAILLGEKILGRSVDVENEPNALDIIDPIPWEGKEGQQTILNRISEASSIFRDRKIVIDILKAVKKYKRIFVVYGASHAVMQEPALRKLENKKV